MVRHGAATSCWSWHSQEKSSLGQLQADTGGRKWQKNGLSANMCKRRKVARLTSKASAATGQLHTMFRSIASRAEGQATKQLKDS